MKKSLAGVSLLTLSGLYFLLVVILLLVCMVTNIPILYGLISSAIILVIQFLISPFITDLTMKFFYKAKWDKELPEYLNKFIDEVCEKHQMKRPKIGYIDDGAPNAFTYGHTKNDARIVVTRGIFELLSEEEVKAVVAHELGHATHYDMLFMTVAQLVPIVMYAIYEATIDAKQEKSSSDNSDNKGDYSFIIGIIAYILYIISNYIVLYLSRTREYYADAFSIEETENPNALASSLVKVGFGLITNRQPEDKVSTKSINALGLFDSKASKSLVVMTNNNVDDKKKIKNAMKWEMWNPWAKWFELNSTHPLISNRLLAISARSEEFKQKPYITFDLQQEESYVDDFLMEIFIYLLPFIVIIIGVVAALTMMESAFTIMASAFLLAVVLSFLAFFQAHKKGYKERKIEDLLAEVKVSGITSIPCIVKGTIIGRGDPGYIFNEDFMVKDETGIIYVDYNSPSFIVNKIMGFFRNKKNMDKEVTVTGWYRRSPVPYIEIQNYEVDGKKHRTGIYTFGIVIRILLIVLASIGVIISIV